MANSDTSTPNTREMSTKELPTEQGTANPGLVGGDGPDKDGQGAGEGSPPATPDKPRKNIGAQGLPVLNVGNPGNKGGGRRPDAIRVVCTEAVEELAPLIRASTIKQAGIANSATSTPDQAARAHAEAVRGFKGLVEAGPGTKVTNVVEREGYHDAASRAYDAHDGSKLSFLELLKKELDGIP